MKSFKVDVSISPYLSEAIQKHAFDLGYTWSSGNINLLDDRMEYIRTDSTGAMSYGQHMTDSDGCAFTEISPLDFLALTKEDVGEPPLMINGHKVIFHDGYIKVGCQKVDNDTVKMIAEKLK